MKFSSFLSLGAAAAVANPVMQYMVLDQVLDGDSSNDSLLKMMLLSPGLLGKFGFDFLKLILKPHSRTKPNSGWTDEPTIAPSFA